MRVYCFFYEQNGDQYSAAYEHLLSIYMYVQPSVQTVYRPIKRYEAYIG